MVLSPIEKQIKEKIERIGTPLKDWDIRINYGIKTGFNDAFIITGEKRKELIEQDPKSEEIIRPILRGRDIKRYGYDFNDKYIICARLITDIPNKYPAIYKHLQEYIGKGKLGDNSTTKVFNRPWWSWMQEPVNYWNELSGQKIIWGEISDKTKFSIDLDGSFLNEATTFLMTGNSLLYLVGFLNSKLSEYFFSKIGTTTGVGTVRWKKFTIEQLFVPLLNSEKQEKYKSLVLEIINRVSLNQDYTDLTKTIDNMIYKEFDFSEKEIEFIEIQ